MKKINKYILNKNSIYKKYSDLNIDTSYNMNKKKENESIGVIKFYNNDLIQRVIKKSIDLKFKKLLELIVSIEESDEDPSSGLLFCLDEVERFKKELMNKYKKFLEKKQIDFLEKKAQIFEKEVKEKLITYSMMRQQFMMNNMQMEEEEEYHRSR